MTSAFFLWAFVLFLTTFPLPHTAHAQWTQAPGTGWAQVSVYHHATSRTYNAEGRPEAIFAGGRAVTTSVYLTAALGLVRGVDAWAQVPFHRLVFTNAAGRLERVGPGDPRLYLRVSPAVWGRDVPIALRGGVKWPGGDFPIDAEIIPLGEGQRDWELMLEFGHSLYPRPVYISGWVGHRWREANQEAARKPGDEWFAFLSAGGQRGRLVWKMVVEGWRGEAPRIQGIVIPSTRQEVVQVLPSLGWRVGPGVMEVGVRAPLAGRNLPAGPAGVVGVFVGW